MFVTSNSGMGNSISFGPFFGTGGYNNRNQDQDLGQRVRVTVSQDTRQQTAYGTLRTYLILGWTHDTPANTTAPSAPGVYFNRGFIQIAGFTFGKATSFFDFASTAAVAYNAGFVTTSDTGDAGQIVGSYTAQFGNGVSATIGIEQSRRNATVWVGSATTTTATPVIGGTTIGVTSTTFSGFNLTAGPTRDDIGGSLGAGTASRPDIVGNLRVDQAWGSAQVMGALHDVSAQSYGGPLTTTVTTNNGHPADKWGWAVGAGLKVNFPMIGPGDYFQAQVGYAEGATKYTTNSSCGGSQTCDYFNGNSFGFGFAEDATFEGTALNPSAIQLTTSWSVFASYEHFWTPSLRTSLYGSYLEVSRNSIGNAQVCFGSGVKTVGSGAITCDMDWSMYTFGSRTQWNVTKDFYVGVDVIYNKLNSATLNGGMPFSLGTNLRPTGRPAGLYTTDDQDQVSVTWRVHRDIVP
jgi:hypothetical protein